MMMVYVGSTVVQEDEDEEERNKAGMRIRRMKIIYVNT